MPDRVGRGMLPRKDYQSNTEYMGDPSVSSDRKRSVDAERDLPEPAPKRPFGPPDLLGHTKLESTMRYLGIEVDDALDLAEQLDV